MVSTYVDGALINTGPLTIVGSVDTASLGLSVNIGQDGTGGYTDGGSAAIEADIDDVMLWNRVVTPTEVSLFYNSGSVGLSPLPIVTSFSRTGNSVSLSWIGGLPPFTIQSKANLTDASWSTVGTTSNHSFTGAISGSSAFVRVRGSNQ
jgi:hypothetical protein